jgi:antitoxin component YwqK of YwqJK toxin-antitoxin module
VKIIIPMKKSIPFLLIIFTLFSCKNPKAKIIETYATGKPFVVFDYPDYNDKSVFTIKVFYQNGNIHRTLPVKSGQFILAITNYSPSGRINQIDSLLTPCDTTTRACDAFRTIYYENGKLAEIYNLRGGKYNGLSRHYDLNGILVKEYYLTNDSIKNGMYRENDRNGKLDFSGFYANDTLTGYSYYFNPNGDTIKYHYNENGQPSPPYKKWLKDGRILTGNYTSKEKNRVVWNWYKNGVKVKTKIIIPGKEYIVVPE